MFAIGATCYALSALDCCQEMVWSRKCHGVNVDIHMWWTAWKTYMSRSVRSFPPLWRMANMNTSVSLQIFPLFLRPCSHLHRRHQPALTIINLDWVIHFRHLWLFRCRARAHHYEPFLNANRQDSIPAPSEFYTDRQIMASVRDSRGPH